ncbi:MAG: hypothetical protein MJ250_06770 [Alphaproteobacteria bacterium]|nr:hypothetical protein [Alphaproteobacteria bacterium]
MEKLPFYDTTEISLNDTTPLKMTFQSVSGTEQHILGCYTCDENMVFDIRFLFTNVSVKTLIPNISSTFLANRLDNRKFVFFLIENGYALNGKKEWFPEINSGKTGNLFAFKHCIEKKCQLSMLHGEFVWKNEQGIVVEQAKKITPKDEEFFLVWQSANGQIYPIQGNILQSIPCNQEQKVAFFPEEETYSLKLSFAKSNAEIFSQPMTVFKLQIGMKNFELLMKNRIVQHIQTLSERDKEILSCRIEIPADFEDTLYVKGIDKKANVLGSLFNIDCKENIVTISNQAPLWKYEYLLSLIFVKTDSSTVAKCPVHISFKTLDGEKLIDSEISMVNVVEEESIPKVFQTPTFIKTDLPTFSLNKDSIFDDYKSKESVPSFLTQNQSVKILKKTAVLIEVEKYKQFADYLASKGWTLILHCSVMNGEVPKLCDELMKKYGIKAGYIQSNLSMELEEFCTSIVDTYGEIDAIVDIAKYIDEKSILTKTTEELLRFSALLSQMSAKNNQKNISVLELLTESSSLGAEMLQSYIKHVAIKNMRVNAVFTEHMQDAVVIDFMERILENESISNQYLYLS